MDDQERFGAHSQEQESEEAEVVDGVVVLAGARAIEPTRTSLPGIRPLAAVAATGFVAGAATAAVVGRCLARRAVRLASTPEVAARSGAVVGVVVSRTNIVALRSHARL